MGTPGILPIFFAPACLGRRGAAPGVDPVRLFRDPPRLPNWGQGGGGVGGGLPKGSHRRGTRRENGTTLLNPNIFGCRLYSLHTSSCSLTDISTETSCRVAFFSQKKCVGCHRRNQRRGTGVQRVKGNHWFPFTLWHAACSVPACRPLRAERMDGPPSLGIFFKNIRQPMAMTEDSTISSPDYCEEYADILLAFS